MSGNITVAESDRVIDAGLGTATYTAPTTPMKLALMSANGDDTTSGTEVVGGTYGRQTIACNAASAKATANTSAIDFTLMPATIVAGFEIYDSAGSPRRVWQGTLPAIAYTVVASTDVFTSSAHGMANGDPVQFVTGQSPTGLSANTTYYVIAATTNTYEVATTVNGSAVNVTADGSGSVVKCQAYTAGNTAHFAAGAITVAVN